ncbi:CYFA0S33e00496g1_1 [Cyberlindnera fabianii]|uniref:CYFA0S33e00496g1_1 n=1 Tax=Cyberlindnera fabianii TaxID=36022 RepID=A0A061BC91_CYBFA|nr:Importin alpha re-exporter [Cyberlindnera fabianii]CDR47565.1 CYFA0S33e00496g1_1 [Cyberlindnera fabianii]
MSDLESIAFVLEQSLAPATAKQAEQQLRSQESQSGFSLTLLHVVASQNLPTSTRLAAALFFKNFIKRRWVDEDGNYLNGDVDAIKSEIIPLMITLPNNLQIQIGEAISIIADSDFPERWPTLIDDLVSKLSDDDMVTNKGVLTVAHSIFKRWRPLFRSDALFLEIKLVLDKFQQPFLHLLKRVDTLITESASNRAQLQILFDVLLLLVKIYHDLNCQDIPEFFEDNMNDGMGLIHKYLIYDNPVLRDDDEETETDVVTKVKTAISELIQLYTTRYEDVFEPLIMQFVQSVWNLLTTIGTQPKYDILVSKLLSFLTCVARLPKHSEVFSTEAGMKEITERIIIPNLTVRESDEELFEDDPIEYIRRDLEGSDSDTRRRGSIDFLRELKSKNEPLVTQVVMSYITHYLQEYANNPSQWKYKDLSIYLFGALASRVSTISNSGITSTNILLDVVQFFANNIVSDLVNDNIHPILKVDAIKYIYTFRSQLTKQQLLESFPILNKHLQSSEYVQYTYASITIERILSLRGEDKKLMFNKTDIQGFVQELLTNLFQLILKHSSTPEKLAENEFLMKTLMRVMSIADDSISTIAPELLKNLLSIVAVISKNPSNPKFSHYTFESIAVLIKYNGTTPQNWQGFMSATVPAFLELLGADVQEFVPYTFQILAYLLEIAPQGTPLPEPYKQLIQPLLSPSVWEFKGNIPAVTRLLQAIISVDYSGFTDITALLGVFQKLISSKLNEYYGFDLLESILFKFPDDKIGEYTKNIAVLLLQRLQNSRTEKYVKRLVAFISKLTVIKSTDYAIEFLDQVQSGIFGTIYEQFLLPSIPNIGNLNEKKIVIIGFSHLITSSKFLQGEYQKLLVPTLETLIQITTSESIRNATADTDEMMELEMEEVSSFGSNFSRLSSIASKPFDPTNMTFDQGKVYFVEQLKKMNEQFGGSFINQVKSQMSADGVKNLAVLGF